MRSSVWGDAMGERLRQIEIEGFDSAHDDKEVGGGLAYAAACYALTSRPESSTLRQEMAEKMWPWDKKWFKPKDPRRDLIRAIALLVAEVERIDRAASNEFPED